MLVFLFPANIGFVNFHDGVLATERPGDGGRRRGADAVAHKPRRLVGNAEQAADFAGAHSLLARAKQVIAEQPLMQRNFGALEHGTHGNGELLAANVALNKSRAVLLVAQAWRVIRTALRADRAVRPVQPLKVLAGCIGVPEGEDQSLGSHLVRGSLGARSQLVSTRIQTTTIRGLLDLPPRREASSDALSPVDDLDEANAGEGQP